MTAPTKIVLTERGKTTLAHLEGDCTELATGADHLAGFEGYRITTEPTEVGPGAVEAFKALAEANDQFDLRDDR